MADFQIGDEVLVTVKNQEVKGRVESIQLNPAKKIDVRVYQPGNTSHGLIVSFAPSEVKLSSDPSASTTDNPGATQKDLDDLMDDVATEVAKQLGTVMTEVSALKSSVSSVSSAVSSLAGRVGSLETSVSSLTNRVTALEAVVAKLANPAPITQEQNSTQAATTEAAASATAATSIPAVKQ